MEISASVGFIVKKSSETPVKNLAIYAATYPTRLKPSSKCCRNPKSRISVEFPKYSYKYVQAQRVIIFGMLQLVVRSNDFHETFILAIFCTKISWADAIFEQNRTKIPDIWHGGPQTCPGEPWCKYSNFTTSQSEKWFPSRLHKNTTHILFAQ